MTAFIWMLSSCSSDDSDLLSDNDSNKSGLLLNVKNYLGNSENIHPKVLYFETPWNGYKYWMSYSPYPKGKTECENPCIAVSNDGINWTSPGKVINPLFREFKSGYNSDPHLVYREDKDIIECWWRAFIEVPEKDLICRRVSKDGINWEETEVVVPSGKTQERRLSPAVIVEDGNYVMFFSDSNSIYETHCSVMSKEFKWSEPKVVPIPKKNLRFWHHDVIRNDDGELEFIINGLAPGETNNSSDLYYSKGNMSQGVFTEPVKIISRSSDPKAFDHRSIYRGSILKVDNKYLIYYSAIDEKWHRHLAIMIGETPFNLKHP